MFEIAIGLEPENFSPKLELANVLGGLGKLKFQMGSLSEALTFQERKLEIYEKILSRDPNNFKFRFQYALALSRLITDGLLDEDTNEFVHTLEQSFEEFEYLLNYDPQNTAWKREYYFYLKELVKRLDNGEFPNMNEEKIRHRFIELRKEFTTQ